MTSVCSRERMAAEPRDESEVEVEDILQPFDRGGGLVGENFDQIWSGLISGRFQCVVVELLYAVLDLVVDLGSGKSSVDAGGGFGGVATEEVYAPKLSALVLRRQAWKCSLFLSRRRTLPPFR